MFEQFGGLWYDGFFFRCINLTSVLRVYSPPAHYSPSMRFTETVLETYTYGVKGGSWKLIPPPHFTPQP